MDREELVLDDGYNGCMLTLLMFSSSLLESGLFLYAFATLHHGHDCYWKGYLNTQETELLTDCHDYCILMERVNNVVVDFL